VDDGRIRLHRGTAQPYTFNPAPFLADDQLGMQGYLSSEPYLVETEGGFTPNVFLIADAGYSSYATTIETMQAPSTKAPRSWNASSTGRSSAGTTTSMATIRGQRDDPRRQPRHDPGQDRLRHRQDDRMGHRRFSGDTLELGIGALTEEVVAGFYEDMVAVGVLEDGLDWSRRVNTSFVNQGLGMELRPGRVTHR
jgi:NitT/TauT family transport system substrate-binding protein